MKEEAEYSIGRFKFKTKSEYEAALDDIKIINSLKRKGDITNPDIANDILNQINRRPGMFETIVGDDFIRQLNIFAETGKDKESPNKYTYKRYGYDKKSLKKKKKKTSGGFKKLSLKKKLAAIVAAVAGCICIYSVGYEIYYQYQSYKSLQKIKELAACILEPINPEVSDLHKQMDIFAGSAGWSLPYEIATKEEPAGKKYAMLNNFLDIQYFFTLKYTKQKVLYKYNVLYERNTDMIGWIKIEDTVIDYPVMQCMDNEEYYLKRDFDKGDDINGLPFMDTECDVLTPTSNFMIYGHNMRNGSMFASLLKYKDEEFYNSHKTIIFDTIYEEGEYEIVSVFQSYIAYENEDVFKYYKFFDAYSKEEYDNYIDNIKRLSLYDTKITPEYGEQLLTLSTCDRSIDDGRFVVVARKINK